MISNAKHIPKSPKLSTAESMKAINSNDKGRDNKYVRSNQL